jgi:3-oxoacid CoA-transferase subunit B
MLLTEVAEGVNPAEVQARTEAKLIVAPDIRTMVAL